MAVRKSTITEVIDQYSAKVAERLALYFRQVRAHGVPEQMLFLAIKDKKVLEVWAKTGMSWQLVKQYPVQAASGTLGPKLREGDQQVPEGIYRIKSLNPNSAYHLSLELDYPNAFDLRQAQSDGRSDPGSAIFIHGKAVSIGCLAIGDPAIEELFTLVHQLGKDKIRVVISPTDPRHKKLVPPTGAPQWTSVLYENIEHTVAEIFRIQPGL
ncbi:MAG: L,D-transpeptidase family protein [Candidatus Competibacteraceae bacterium]|jgi:murein L,D-transpeptidase YafK|nr:L,D-transpeptidase family protein [Candidatus Competibacteraceae bacterium]